MRRFYDICEGVKKFNTETFEMRQSSRRWINAQSVFFSLHFSICCVAITHMASSSRRLYLFLQLICISRISQNKVLADDCPFEKEVKCTFTESNDPGKKPVYFMSGRSPTTFIRCDPDPLPSYHLYPGGSGSTCQTFQYMFTENKIALSKKLQTQSQPAFKAVIEEGDVWAIKFKETVWKPFIAKDKTGSQKDIFAHSSSATSHLKLQDVFLFNFEIKEITFPTSDPFRSGPY